MGTADVTKTLNQECCKQGVDSVFPHYPGLSNPKLHQGCGDLPKAAADFYCPVSLEHDTQPYSPKGSPLHIQRDGGTQSEVFSFHCFVCLFVLNYSLTYLCFMCIGVLPTGMSVRRCQIPRNWSYRQLRAAVWVPGIEPGSSGRSASVL